MMHAATSVPDLFTAACVPEAPRTMGSRPVPCRPEVAGRFPSTDKLIETIRRRPLTYPLR